MVEFDKIDPLVLSSAKYLRNSSQSSLKIFEGIMADKRVDVFKGSSAIKILLSENYMKRKNCFNVTCPRDAEDLLQQMLDYGVFIRSVSSNGTKFLQPDLSRKWSEDALYAWVLESSQFWTFLGAFGLLLVSFGIVMYPLWPSSLRNLSWYVMMLLVAFLVFLIVISIIRIIVFGITYFMLSPGIWIFPNLYEDVSFIESFIPLYDWHKSENSENLKSKKND
jgi:translocation protein SEC62